LLWNGGIGTYVKASDENHNDVGDTANNALRVDGKDLRCRVVGEGGNLGLTQKGRIEYAKKGGKVNTDFIDNSAGVFHHALHEGAAHAINNMRSQDSGDYLPRHDR